MRAGRRRSRTVGSRRAPPRHRCLRRAPARLRAGVRTDRPTTRRTSRPRSSSRRRTRPRRRPMRWTRHERGTFAEAVPPGVPISVPFRVPARSGTPQTRRDRRDDGEWAGRTQPRQGGQDRKNQPPSTARSVGDPLPGAEAEQCRRARIRTAVFPARTFREWTRLAGSPPIDQMEIPSLARRPPASPWSLRPHSFARPEKEPTA